MFAKTNLNLVLRNWKRNKVFSVISILSLIIGLACANLLIAFVVSEYQISQGSPDNDRIFMLKSDNPMDVQGKEKTSFILSKLPPFLKERYPEVDSYCRFQSEGADENAVFESDNFKSDNLLFVRADQNLNEFFNLPIVAGNLQKTLSNPGEAAITTQMAKLIFGDADVLGKSFTINSNDKKNLYKITAIIDGAKTASFLKFDVLLPINTDTYFGGVTFVKLDKKASATPVLAKMKEDGSVLPKLTEECQYYIQPITDVYLDNSETQSNWEFLMHRDKLFIYIGIIAAIAILFISGFNYINMYLVRIFKNEKNTGIQTILGANKKQLRLQLFTETFLAVITSFMFSIGLVILLIPIFNSVFTAHISAALLINKTVLTGYSVLIVLLTVIPSLYLLLNTNKNPINQLFNGKNSYHKARVANGMVILQFTISIILIIGAMFYSKQLGFISKTANIDKNIIEINANNLSPYKLKTFKTEITGLKGINSGTISGTGFFNAWIGKDDDNIPILSYSFDSDFLKTHHLKLLSGEGFSENETINKNQVIVNETLIKKFGITDPIGKPLSVLGTNLIIKGVIADFYTESFNKQIRPTIISPFNFDTNHSFQVLQLQLSDNGLAPTLAEIKSRWETYFPDKIFNYSFIQDQFNEFHRNYIRTAKIIDFFTIISLFLTAFGLFGMTWYSVERRTKEIGIRKVNGARITEVIAILNRDFVKWVVIAFVIAAPIAYYTMNRWLESFAYKTSLSWRIFALAGVLAMGIALLTVSFQSWRAATRNPVESLRYE